MRRRQVLAALGAGLGAGAGVGYVAGSRPWATESDPPVAPLSTVPTEWPFADYDRGRTRNPPPDSAPDGDVRERWRRPRGEHARPASPAVGNGRVLVATGATTERPKRFTLASVDLASGDPAWTWRVPTTESSFYGAAVAAAGDGVYCGVDLGDGSSPLLGLAATTGTEYWRHPGFGEKVHSPITVEGYLLVRRPNGVAAFDAHSGKKAWEWGADRDDYVPTAPAAGDRAVVATGAHLVGLDPRSGTERWRGEYRGNPEWGPVLADGRAYLSTLGGDLAAYDAATGDRVWRRSVTGPVDCEGGECARWIETGAVADGALVTVEHRADAAPSPLRAHDPADGTVRWTVEPVRDGSVRFTAPVVVDGTVYVGEDAYGDGAGAVTAVDLATGERSTVQAFDAGVSDLVVADGWLFAVTGGALVALR